jgi:G:T-mismatch repair DNA endonuclease (very short patch repair protein)
MQIAKLCVVFIKECFTKDFNHKTLLAKVWESTTNYFTSTALRHWWSKKRKKDEQQNESSK